MFTRILGPRRPKIFVIGFNKTGTTSIHRFFKENGVRAAHCRFRRRFWHRKESLALKMRDNIAAQRPVLDGIEYIEAFSDLTSFRGGDIIEANAFFKRFHAEYPDAYFILNDRPVDAWIASRLNHVSRSGVRFVDRYAVAKGLDCDAVVDFWREAYAQHKNDVLSYFAGNKRFLHFPIDTGTPEILRGFLADAYDLDVTRWRHRGSQEERTAKFVRRSKS